MFFGLDFFVTLQPGKFKIFCYDYKIISVNSWTRTI